MSATATFDPTLLPRERDLAELERHHEEHGFPDFDPERDVSFEGNTPESPLLTWNALERSFGCSLCPGLVHVVDPEPSPLFLQPLLQEPALAPFLSGVGTQRERLEVARRVLRGDYGRLLLGESQRKERTRTARASRPKVARKRANCQSYLLETYALVGNVERTIQTLIDLRTSNPGGYFEIVGSNLPVAYDTLRGYWRGIPPGDRVRAKTRSEEARAARRAARVRNGLEP